VNVGILVGEITGFELVEEIADLLFAEGSVGTTTKVVASGGTPFE
jgi:hypothetical protein